MSNESVSSLQAEVNRLRIELQALQAKNTSEQIEIGNYLLARLEQLNVRKMFGVPGDFNLGFLDLVEDHPAIDWVGNCNELNASYAADGYARVKEHSLGVVLTTFGVGELSAINGIAGAFSEMVPVLHVVGVPSTIQQQSKPLLHHTLGDGRYDAYVKAAEKFTISQGMITHPDSAAATIDRTLVDCITRARPAYLTLPTNLVSEKISSERLKIPLSRTPPPNDHEVEGLVLDEILKLVKNANDEVVMIVDGCTIRHDVREEVNELAKKTGFPVYAAPMGKTAVSESYERYGGINMGSVSEPDVKNKVESAKLILSIGCIKSDYNTGNFTYSIPPTRTVEIPKFIAVIPKEASETITHAWLWPRMSKFFRPRDVIVAETGTSNSGVLDVSMPEQAVFVSQILWGSIGTLGAALAARESGLNRTILFIGDGSVQLTVQELSVMLRQALAPLIFVINNSGYEIERRIHGRGREYNEIAEWKWTELLSVLGNAAGKRSKSYSVRTKSELSALLDTELFADAGKMQLVEVNMPKNDVPRALKVQAEISG
ncbi:thiamine diphosphate-binding protein [Mycena galopus ATCC 62051]|nr:thiamine diphosphate-binding protein [Mycena galopus ATCC 62051]